MPKTNVEFASRMDHIREEFQVFEKSKNFKPELWNTLVDEAKSILDVNKVIASILLVEDLRIQKD